MSKGRQLGRHNASRWGLLQTSVIMAVAMLALTGCGRSKSPGSGASVPSVPPPKPVPAVGETASAAPAAPAQPEVAQAPANATENEDNLRQLNLMVSEYKGSFNKLPRDLHEFVERGYFAQLPAAPEGKQYHMNPDGKVVLVAK